MNESAPSRPQSITDRQFLRRMLIAVAVVGLALAAWRLASVLMLLFGAILVSVLITGLVEVVARFTYLNRRVALPVVVVGLTAAIGGIVVLFGTQVSGQLDAVFAEAPAALDALGQQFGVMNASDRVGEWLSGSDGIQLFSNVAIAGYTVVGIVTGVVLVVVAAIFLAADPETHRRGVTMLFPVPQHERILTTMTIAGRALRLWFLGQAVSMVLVGALSAVAFWIIGLPSPIGLGVIAGVTNFIPFVGPFIGALPAVLLAFPIGMAEVLWTLAAVVIVQQLDANVFMPVVQRRAVDLPPTVALFSVLVFGTLFGLLGIVLAAPLAVVGLVLIEKLWVKDGLGEEVRVPGEPEE